MNLRSFTYEDLEEATSGFKEELGKGSFGTVYKGVLASSHNKYVVVRKLDKMVREDEREFKTDVTVIGQTHHKNLVWLLGYYDVGED
nr:g-type lectin s-receptor-like serine/threonine-protein kinase rlk1 [Quercus suber]